MIKNNMQNLAKRQSIWYSAFVVCYLLLIKEKIMSKPISSQASIEEGSETIPQGSTAQVSRKRPAPNNWGDDIVQSSWKREAVLKLLVSKVLISDTKCWEWQGSKTLGYGSFKLPSVYGDFKILAHRASWVAFKGETIPDGLFVCHKCDNSKCFNPDHLFLGTQKDNLQDCSEKGRTLTGARSYTSKFTKDEIGKALKLLNDGFTGKEVSRLTGISPTHISRIRRGYTWKAETAGDAKTYNANRKYTDEMLEHACKLIIDGSFSNIDIEKITNVNKCVVSDIKRGKIHQRFMERVTQ